MLGSKFSIPGDRVLITGVTGWLGRELVAILHERNPNVHILGVGRKQSELLVGGRTIQVVDWESDEIENWRPEIVCHLAFLTREFLETFGESEFTEINASISRRAQALVVADSVKSAILVSSGAAIQAKLDLYGELKRIDEREFAAVSEETGKALTIARAWSLSGAHCTKPQNFLLYSLIAQALSSEGEIRISSNFPVKRRYVDAGEFLHSAMMCTPQEGCLEFNSYGELIEANELTDLIQKTLGTQKEIVRPDVNWADHRGCYFTTDQAIESVLSMRHIRYSPLNVQVRKSVLALTDQSSLPQFDSQSEPSG